MGDPKRARSLPPATLGGTEVVEVLTNPNANGPLKRTTTQDIANLSPASLNAQFIVAAASADLGAERVATDTATVAWDFGTAAQAKASVPDGAITAAKLANAVADALWTLVLSAAAQVGSVITITATVKDIQGNTVAVATQLAFALAGPSAGYAVTDGGSGTALSTGPNDVSVFLTAATGIAEIGIAGAPGETFPVVFFTPLGPVVQSLTFAP